MGQQSQVPAWWAAISTQMVANRSWALPLNPKNEVVIDGAYPRLLQSLSNSQLLSSLNQAVQGASTKELLQGQANADGTTALTLAFTSGTRVFGARLRISDSPQLFPFSTINFSILNGNTTMGKVYVYCRQLPVDIVVLAISSSAGVARPTFADDFKITIPNENGNAIRKAATWFSAETLNARDLSAIQ